MNNDEIIKYFFSNEKINNNKIKEYNKGLTPINILEYLNNIYIDSDNLIEKLWRIKLNIIDKPVCKFCGCNVKHKAKGVYQTYCSNTCRNKDLYETNRLKTIEKYGSSFNRTKCEETKLNKYGDKNYNNSNKISKTLLNKSYKEKNIINDKKINTVLNKYNVINISQLDNIKKQKENTCIKNYGVNTYLKTPACIENRNKYFIENKKEIIEKIQNTCLNKYGVKAFNPVKSKQTKLEKYGDEYFNNREKYKETLFKKYGVINSLQIPEVKGKVSKKLQLPEIQQKINNTKHKNNSFHTSKPELESYDLLKQKYPDVIHQYRNFNKYPFNCDFYIPSLDLFIECQYGQFHHGRPYLGTEEDLKDVEMLKQNAERRHKETRKNKSIYDAILETWVISDVKKRNIAKENNLNYIEFWNINEFKKWLASC